MQPNHKIIGGFNRREPEAVAWVYETYQSNVYTVTRRLVGEECPDLPDLVAEVFARLIEQKDRFPNLSRLKSFLYLTTRNACLNHIRKQEIIADAETTVSNMDNDGMALKESLAHFQSLVTLAIERLPPKTKEVFLLFYKKQLSNTEIAQKLSMAEKTVANQKTMAIKLLKIELQNKKGFIFLFNVFL